MSQSQNRGAGGFQGSQRPGGGYPPRGGDDRRPREEPATIDLSGIVFGEKLAADLFSAQAERAAEAVSQAAKDLNKSSQLRRFYDELVMWQERVGVDATRFADSEPYIRMLKAKAAYAKGRGHVDANFRALFDRLIDQSIDPVTLRQAKLFFEAFMAYYKIFRTQ